MLPKLVAVTTQKGGVGKSSLTIMLASHLRYNMGRNVVVIDCDSPQYSMFDQRVIEKQIVDSDPLLQVKNQSKAHSDFEIRRVPIKGALAEVSQIISLSRQKEEPIDYILFDLPGRLNDEGLTDLLMSLDYVFIPFIPDLIVIKSSGTFLVALQEQKEYNKKCRIREIIAFWNCMDPHLAPDMVAKCKNSLTQREVRVLQAEVGNSIKFFKSISSKDRDIFRSTLFPPDKKQLKGTRIDEWINEVVSIIDKQP